MCASSLLSVSFNFVSYLYVSPYIREGINCTTIVNVILNLFWVNKKMLFWAAILTKYQCVLVTLCINYRNWNFAPYRYSVFRHLDARKSIYFCHVQTVSPEILDTLLVFTWRSSAPFRNFLRILWFLGRPWDSRSWLFHLFCAALFYQIRGHW